MRIFCFYQLNLNAFRYSSHEQWKFLMMPYQSIDIANRVLLNMEKARTWNSALNYIPGNV